MFGLDSNRTELSLGLGFPEALNFGIRYQINQKQVGGSLGVWPGNSDSFLFDFDYVLSLCADYAFHFGGVPKYTDLKPWFGRVGLNSWLLSWGSRIEPYLNIPLRVGRDIPFGPSGGFSLEGGIIIVVADSGSGINSLMPSLGIRLFFRK